MSLTIREYNVLDFSRKNSSDECEKNAHVQSELGTGFYYYDDMIG